MAEPGGTQRFAEEVILIADHCHVLPDYKQPRIATSDEILEILQSSYRRRTARHIPQDPLPQCA